MTSFGCGAVSSTHQPDDVARSRSSIGTLSSSWTTLSSSAGVGIVKRVLHVMRVGGIVAAQRSQERKHVLADDGIHLRGSENS